MFGLLLLAGCGGAASPAGGPPAGEAKVGLIEWEITTSAPALLAGPVVLEVTNAGSSAHDLRVEAGGVDAALATLAPGEGATLELDVPAGSEALLYCTLPGHRTQGMERRLPVSG